MKGKQRILALMLAMMMLVCCASCGSTGGDSESSKPSESKGTEQTSEPESSEKTSEGAQQPEALDEEPLALKEGNIFKNPFFEEGDKGWTEENTNSPITKVTTDSEIFKGTGIKTYGAIARDPETSTQFECFAQDVTDVIDNDMLYEFEFYVMLSEDYKDADENMRTVAFAPFYTLDGQTSYLGTYSTNEISGESSLICEVGEWTKFSGTFQLACEKKPERVVVRILEQGYDYQDAESCVRGDYYVTGLCLRDAYLD